MILDDDDWATVVFCDFLLFPRKSLTNVMMDILFTEMFRLKKKNKTKVCQSTCPTTTCFSKNPPSRIRTNSSRVAKSAWEKSSGGGVKHLLEMIPHPICGKFVEMIPNLWEI